MNDGSETLAVTLLADIDPPPPPAVLAPAALACLLLMATVVLAIAWRLRSEARAAPAVTGPARTLESLEGDWAAGRIGERRLAYEFAALLRYHYGLPGLDRRLPADCPLAPGEWRRLIEWLDRGRYSPRPPAPTRDAFTLMRRCLETGGHA